MNLQAVCDYMYSVWIYCGDYSTTKRMIFTKPLFSFISHEIMCG